MFGLLFFGDFIAPKSLRRKELKASSYITGIFFLKVPSPLFTNIGLLIFSSAN